MEIKIINEHLENSDGDLLFHQPKYHFGQKLIYGKSKNGLEKSGIVLMMKFTGEWSYALFNLETDGLTDWYKEDDLSRCTYALNQLT